VFIDGQVIEAEVGQLSLRDRGLLLGDGLFEVFRTFHGRAATMPAHVARLVASGRALRLTMPAPEALAAAVEQVIAASEGEVTVRIVVTRGPGGVRAPLSSLGLGTWFVLAEPLAKGLEATALHLVTSRQTMADGPTARHKTLSFFERVWALQEALDQGADEVVRVDAAGRVCECATANLFAVQGDRLLTPSLELPILPGITRQLVIDTAKHLGIAIVEGELHASRLAAAQAIFVTSAVRGVVPVASLDGTSVPLHPVVDRVREGYLATVGAAVGKGPGL
jgi:branched-chain amino acid aminotransferase